MHQDHSHYEPPSVHGMLIVGDSKLFLFHLPVFHSPHDYQILLEVIFAADSGDPSASYREDRRTTGEKVYTWVPRPFVLPQLNDGSAPASMTSTIFRGHFERGEVAISSGRVQANVVCVLHFRRFTPDDVTRANLKYILFGSREESFLAHFVETPPDYDQILSVDLQQPPAGWNGAGLTLELQDRPDGIGLQLREGEQVEAAGTSPSDGTVKLSVTREIYFETGDLAA